MGLYLRKAFSFGPIRVNLSKSGLGLSAGVPGARVGITSEGRSYVHAGRGGLYARHFFDARTRSPGGSPRGRVTLIRETGATYGTPRTGTPSSSLIDRLEPATRHDRMAWWVCVVGAFALVLGLMSMARTPAAWPVVVVAATAILCGPVVALRSRIVTRRSAELSAQLETGIRTGADPRSLSEAVDRSRLSDGECSRLCGLAYLDALDQLVEDGATPEAFHRLESLASALSLDAEFRRESHLCLYEQVHLAAVGDHDLTEAEQILLERLRAGLNLTHSLHEEARVLEELEAVRRIRQGELTPVAPGHPLRRGETCYFRGRGRLVKSRQLERFQRDGQRYEVRGFVVDAEGDLLVTDRRLLLVHEGSSSIRLDRVLDVEVDHDRKLLTITRDGRKRPTYLSTPRALEVGALVVAMAGRDG